MDTPGIGGDGQVCKYAEQYLSKSYGFIYVINSANAGGVQKGRVSWAFLAQLFVVVVVVLVLLLLFIFYYCELMKSNTQRFFVKV